MQDKLNSAEVEELEGLIRDFPDQHPPEEATVLLNEIATRTSIIENNLKGLIPDSTVIFPHIFNPNLAESIHGFMFKGILSNAGSYRNLDDVNKGKVVFGGQKRNEYKSWFDGCSPDIIPTEVAKSFELLTMNPSDPVDQVLRFYQSFVYIHPFYDGNGRVGRIITSIYLMYFGHYVQWKNMEGKSKMINKLNECHKRIGKYEFETYFKYLVNYFRSYVVSLDNLSTF